MSSEEVDGTTRILPDGAEPEDAPARERFATGTAIGHYEIIRPIGEGGMGEVYLARDTRLGRRVALKFLVRASANLLGRFMSEARTTAQLTHENIVALYDLGWHEELPYLVLEYVPGKTMAAWLVERGEQARSPKQACLPPARAAELMIPVVRALVCAHAAGVVHRDLKPSNIMLSDSGAVKVLDFGIAKLLGGAERTELAAPLPGTRSSLSPTEDGAVIGTRPYMAPEQWARIGVDGRTDVWAVGVLLHHLLVGEHPLGELTPAVLATVAHRNVAMPSTRERFPETGRLGAIIDRCLLKDINVRMSSAKQLLEELEAIARPSSSFDAKQQESPYAGLAPFQERDAGRFFGRESAVEQVVTRLVDQPLIALVGSSGTGKSSFVRAGVIPALKRGGEAWESFVMRPGPHPVAALAELLLQHAWLRSTLTSETGAPANEPVDRDQICRQLEAEPGHLGVQMRARARRRLERIVLFVDQFEEIVTLASEAERATFLACVAGAADDMSSPLRVIVSVRQDYLDRVAAGHPEIAELLSRGTVLLGPMGRRELKSALVKPAELFEHRFEPDLLVDEMIDDVAGTSGALPLLQFTANRLWEDRDRERRLLTSAAYHAFGGVSGALASHATSVLAGMSVVERRWTRALLLRLVTSERTRAVVTRGELAELTDAPELERVLGRLIDARLLTVEGAGREESTVELVHESLITSWPELARWLEEEQGDAQLLARLRYAAKEWEASQMSEGLLWRGDPADEARRWHARRAHDLRLPPREARYLDAVLALTARERKGRRRRTGALFAALIATVLVVSGLALRARTEAIRAEAARSQAAESATQARNAGRMAVAASWLRDPTTVLALVREIEPGSVPRGWAQLARWALDERVAVRVLDHDDTVYAAVFADNAIVTGSQDKLVRVWSEKGPPRALRGHEGSVMAVAVSPDGSRIASGSEDKTIRVWSGEESIVVRGHEGRVSSVSFSPDGQRIVSASVDQTVRVWTAQGAAQLVLRGHEGRVRSASFSPDGQRIVSVATDKTVRVWSADGTGAAIVLRHEGPVSSAQFSPDGQQIATASGKVLRLWKDGAIVREMTDFPEPISHLAFSPDGRTLIAASELDLYLLRADGSDRPAVLHGHADAIFSVAFGKDGRHVVTASRDRTARVWEAFVKDQPIVLRGHDDWVFSASFSPDGERVVSGSRDRSVRVWRADGKGEPIVLTGHEDTIYGAAFDAEGRRIVSGSADGTVRVWSLGDTAAPQVLRGHTRAVRAASFSPDGARILSASADRTARIWSAEGDAVVLSGHDDSVLDAAFSADGLRVVSGSVDKTVRVWSADGAGPPVILRGHTGEVYGVAFSPDGARVASGSSDGTVRIWSADGSGDPIVLTADGAPCGINNARAFSRDGKRLISNSDDGTVRIWSTDGKGEPITLRATSKAVNDASFSPDDRRIVAATDDHTVIIWSNLRETLVPGSAELWTATSYCMPLEKRKRILDFPEAQSAGDLAACQRKVSGW